MATRKKQECSQCGLWEGDVDYVFMEDISNGDTFYYCDGCEYLSGRKFGAESKKERTKQIIPESGLIDKVDQPDTVDESPEQIIDTDSKLIDSVLSSALGDVMLEKLKELAVIDDFEIIDNADNALVFGGSTQNEIKFLQFRKGENFLTEKAGPKDNSPLSMKGAKRELSSMEMGSLSAAADFSDENIKKAIGYTIERLLTDFKSDDTRARQAARLKQIQRITESLTTVFGFDDPRQAEAFIAAWLMKDSTCRLSGIPGTGKTTAVESAGLLLANSYGFSEEIRFIPKKPKDKDSTFFQFMKGQEYDAYLNNNTQGIRVAWEDWRFSEWYVYHEKTGRKINRQDRKKKHRKDIEVSGSYLFDNTFLQKTYEVDVPESGERRKDKIGSMNPGEFREALLNVWIWKQEKTSLLDDSKYFEFHILPINLGLEAFANGVGKIAQGDPHPALEDMKKSVPEVWGEDEDGKKIILNKDDIPDYRALFTVNYGRILSPGITVPDGSTLAEEVTRLNLRTDAGRNEGYDLREWLMTHYYDTRVLKDDDNPAGWTEIKGEMLREIGTAKIDYDKRADEVLYGMDITQVTKPDPIDKLKTISSYEFEPIPRPVVTQPIKFFNEANRSQAGVEDAILGLIAEKEVEYRGRSFRSPSFVAWMDTNPHQKGNDLAFVDRIDMELLFSTVTLGQRYIQLNAQYNPESISTENMEKEAITQPQDRIIFDYEIGIASDTSKRAKSLRVTDLMKLWKHINKIPFSNTGGDINNYNGLRDISLLSVMFTQRFMSKPRENQTGSVDRRINLPDAQKIHSSPLIDISKSSNIKLLEGEVPEGFTRNSRAFGFFAPDATTPMQTPVVFTRVLGYRFTQSLVKLSRAFAFLRGKDFVGRTEILDALPYVVGHRMGPARAGSETVGGRDVGFKDDAMGSLTSEQEMVKELIVGGYVKTSTNRSQGGDGVWCPLADTDSNPNEYDRKNTLLDVWDAYYQRCVSILQSAGNFTEYEMKVLHPLKEAINGGSAVDDGAVGDGGEGGGDEGSIATTPIHWHIAAMVVEREKKANEGDCLRQDDNKTYHARYNDYFKAMNAPTRYDINPLGHGADVPETEEAIGGPDIDYSLYDYYYLRGKIARDPLLFTDDKTYLLGLLESRIQAFVGAPFNLALDNTSKVLYALSTSNIWDSASELVSNYNVQPNPGVALNSTYNDAIGGYGQLFGQMGENFNINSLMPSDDYDKLFLVKTFSEYSYQMSNQRMRITGSYQHKQDRNNDFIPISTKTARSPRTYLAASDAVTDAFSPWTQGLGGVIIDPGTGNITEGKLDFGVTMEDIESALESILLNPTMKFDEAIQKVSSSQWMESVFTPTGAIFCFELLHHVSSREANSLLLLMKNKGLIDQDATEVPGDKLKLWIWIAANLNKDDEEGKNRTISLVTTYGITSGFLENFDMIEDEIDIPGTFVSIDNENFYQSGSSDETTYLDSGNITEADVNAYNHLFTKAVRRSTQGS